MAAPCKFAPCIVLGHATSLTSLLIIPNQDCKVYGCWTIHRHGFEPECCSGVYQLGICQQAVRSAHSVAANAGAGTRQEPLQKSAIVKVRPVVWSLMIPRCAAGVHLVPSLYIL